MNKQHSPTRAIAHWPTAAFAFLFPNHSQSQAGA